MLGGPERDLLATNSGSENAPQTGITKIAVSREILEVSRLNLTLRSNLRGKLKGPFHTSLQVY